MWQVGKYVFDCFEHVYNFKTFMSALRTLDIFGFVSYLSSGFQDLSHVLQRLS